MALPKLGELMMRCDVITQEQLERALEIQKVQRKPVGRILIEIGAISESQLNSMLEYQLASFSI